MRILLSVALLLVLVPSRTHGLEDSDHDGLSDAVENALLTQFAPRFMVSGEDCSLQPAEFVPFLETPHVERQDGTIYGQAFPRKGHNGQVELHYYHLWKQDCGEMGHPLDAEHVSALLVRDDRMEWKALYWYAAAHEDTVCDASQVARASAVKGELHGPTIWISRGKHASFFSDFICTRGCGGDSCLEMQPMTMARLINLGEPSSAMNGATWVDSPQWPLAAKMVRSDFAQSRIERLNRLPATSVVWANPEKIPMQAAILGGNGAVRGTSAGLHSTDIELDVAGSSTGTALDTASDRTGKGLARTAQDVKKALCATARKLGISK